ncbi:hypothetical protein CCAX7_60920 [Capsulimonas corticalis]|uniref:Uncharacterized protein n=1 Tax=Capsulimonas corticalis TaxID=2219043 RepID=A0A402CW81_9BACT|nr:hypothetical protein CCAX7_60920 [Capsulimonas corticalis]
MGSPLMRHENKSQVASGRFVDLADMLVRIKVWSMLALSESGFLIAWKVEGFDRPLEKLGDAHIRLEMLRMLATFVIDSYMDIATSVDKDGAAVTDAEIGDEDFPHINFIIPRLKEHEEFLIVTSLVATINMRFSDDIFEQSRQERGYRAVSGDSLAAKDKLNGVYLCHNYVLLDHTSDGCGDPLLFFAVMS